MNPAGADSGLLVVWGQLRCRKMTTIQVDEVAASLLVTIEPIGSGDCDSIGDNYAAHLLLDRGIDAASVAIRQVHEGLGGIDWIARSPMDAGETVEIIDRALALTEAVLDVPPRVTPEPDRVSRVVEGPKVSLAWVEPCGFDSQFTIDGTPQAPELRLRFIDVSPCAGTAGRGLTLTFAEPQGAANLSIMIDRSP